MKTIEEIIINEFENSKHAVVVEDDGVIGIVKTDYKSMAKDVAEKIEKMLESIIRSAVQRDRIRFYNDLSANGHVTMEEYRELYLEHKLKEDVSYREKTFVCQKCPTSFQAESLEKAKEIAITIPCENNMKH